MEKEIFYHASQVPDLEYLEPKISNHNVPLIYFSKKRENVLVYLSNAIEKCCKEAGFEHTGKWYKWGPYGFDKDGRLRIEEYYHDALRITYQGVSGYIYQVENIVDSGYEVKIPDAATSSVGVKVSGVEFISDAYEAILKAEKDGLISILRYEDLSEQKKVWLADTILQEHEDSLDKPDYRFFLEKHFPDILASRENDICIETADLILSKAKYTDWEPLLRNIWSHEESAKYMLWNVTNTEEDAKARIIRTIEFEKNEKNAFIVYLKKTKEAIGFATMRECEPGVYEEMGIAIGPTFVRRGYGKQILNALCTEAKKQGAKEFKASYREKNLPSKGMIISCGFEFDFKSEEKTDPRTGEKYFVINCKKLL